MDLLSTYALNLTRVHVFMFLSVKQYTSLPEIQIFFSMVKRDRVPWNYFYVSYEFVMLLVFGTKHQNVLCSRGGGGELDLAQQKYLTIWQHSCEWNRWRGEFVLERPSSETKSISVAMECWSVGHQAFAVETYF